MKFSENCRWWARAAARPMSSLDGRLLAMLSVGGILVAILFSAWRHDASADDPIAETGVVAPSAVDIHQLPAVQVRLRADAAGRLAAIFLNDRPVRDAAELRARVKAFAGPDATVEAILDCDATLRYDQTQGIIEAISNYPSADGRTSFPLVNRVKFRPKKYGI